MKRFPHKFTTVRLLCNACRMNFIIIIKVVWLLKLIHRILLVYQVYQTSFIFSVNSVLLYSREIRDIHILKVDSRCQIFMRTTIHYAMKALWQHWLWSFHFKVQVFCEGHKIFEVIFHLVLTLLSDVKSKWKITPTLGIHPVLVYSQVPIKQVGPNKRVGWIF